MKISLPSEPIHLHTIEWWEVSSFQCNVRRHWITYHVHTKWSDFDPESVGADLVHEWMHHEEGSEEGSGYCTGRSPGWNTPETWESDEHPRMYATKEEATTKARELLDIRIERLNEEIARLQEVKASL